MRLAARRAQRGLIAAYLDVVLSAPASHAPGSLAARGDHDRTGERERRGAMLVPLRRSIELGAPLGVRVQTAAKVRAPALDPAPSAEAPQLPLGPRSPDVLQVADPLRIAERRRELGSCAKVLNTTGSASGALDTYLDIVV